MLGTTVLEEAAAVFRHPGNLPGFFRIVPEPTAVVADSAKSDTTDAIVSPLCFKNPFRFVIILLSMPYKKL